MRSILVVDVDPSFSSRTRERWTDRRCDLRLAVAGPETVSEVTEGTYDAVLTELRMPNLSGEQVAAAVREACPGVPVIAMCDDPVEAQAAEGFDAVLIRPFTVLAACQTIKRLLDDAP